MWRSLFHQNLKILSEIALLRASLIFQNIYSVKLQIAVLTLTGITYFRTYLQMLLIVNICHVQSPHPALGHIHLYSNNKSKIFFFKNPKQIDHKTAYVVPKIQQFPTHYTCTFIVFSCTLERVFCISNLL